MKQTWLSGALALVLGVGAVAAPASAQQVCPPGYYFASNGVCYPHRRPPPAPVYYQEPPVVYVAPPPVYYAPEPVYQPPLVFGGIGIDLNFGGGGHHRR